jgi:hypothetical protein
LPDGNRLPLLGLLCGQKRQKKVPIFQFNKDFMKSKSQNTHFLDNTLQGRIDLVLPGDEILLER